MPRYLRALAQRLLAPVFLFALFTLPVQAQTSPAVTRGVSWLSSQVHGDGSLAGEASSIATPMQARSDTVLTLQQLSSLPASIPANVAAISENNTQYLARKVLVLGAAGMDASALVNVLVPRQNYDGGFGSTYGYASSVADTSWAVLAMAQAGRGSSPAAVKARAYLAAQVSPDGGVYDNTPAGRLYKSAVALQALETTPDNSSASAIGSLASWLKMEQGTDGSWSGSTFLTAYVLLAVAPVNSDNTVNGNAASYLLGKQGSDGAWNDDPYLTAVALRALSLQPPSNAGQAAIQGQVVDGATNLPLSGAAITIVGSSGNTVSDNNGNFTLSGLATGSYSVGVAVSGYIGVTKTANVAIGQITNLGTIALGQVGSAAIVRGQIVTAGSGTPLAGVTVAISGASIATAVTDSGGRYVITGATPGIVTFSASLSGYQTVSATATLVAGQTISFAPGMTPTGQSAPGSIVYSGTVVSSGTLVPLSGVTVQLSGTATAAASTDSNGNFSVTLNPGTYSAAFALAGYTSQTQNIAAAAGTTVNAGIIDLTPVLTSSTIKGVVQNAGNQPVAGATVQIVGGAQATTAADGSYAIANVSSGSLTLHASATGYDTQTVNLTLSQAAVVTQNFALQGQSAGTLAIGALNVTPGSVGLRANVTVSTTFTNTGAAAATAVAQLQVSDSSGNIIGSGAGYDSSGNRLGQIALDAGQSIPVSFLWNSAQFAPGIYQLKVRLIQPGSITRLTPQGTALAESATGATVTGQAHFSGTVSANPPVLQAGTNTAVQFTATIKNDGNIPLAAQTLTLTVSSAADGSVATQGTANIALTPVSGLQTISFPNWTPTAGSNYKLVVSASDSSLGSLTGALYVGDAGSAIYTTSKQVVPIGTQKVRGSLQVSGQDVAGGTISDPLAPLIKAAVQQAIPYGYTTAAEDTVADRCTRCHVHSQALVGGELTSKLIDYASYESSRNTILNALTTTQQSNGSLDGHTSIGPYAYDETELAMWALNTWHKPGEVASTLAKGAVYLVGLQNPDGTWSNDYSGGWWDSTTAITAFNMKSLIDTDSKLAQLPAGTAVRYGAVPVVSQGIVTPSGMTTDAAGNVYVANRDGGNVLEILPNGTTRVFASGFNDATGITFAGDGTAYISSESGLFQVMPGGSPVQLSSQRCSGLAVGPDGNIYIADVWDNKILRVTPAGVTTDYIVGAALQGPWAVAFSAAGDLLVTSLNGESLLRFHPDLSEDIPIAWTYGRPYGIQVTPTGYILTTEAGLFSYNNDWHAERLLSQFVGGVTVTPDGAMWFADVYANTVSKAVATPIDTAALHASSDAEILKSTNWLLQDANVPSDNNMQIAQRLIGLTSASQYYKGQALGDTLQAKMLQVGAQLRANVNADGGWGLNSSYQSDSLVTAQVGFALDALNPSASDPIVQNAVKLILSRQHADGTWYSEDGIMATPLATTTWVSIWLPIVLDRLGGIDTDLSVTFPSNVTMSNPDAAPASLTPNADGSNTALWHLTGVTSAGQTVNYDLTLANMHANEVRAVSTDAHLTFNNSFTNGTVNAAIAIPNVTASAYLNLGLTTDQSSYPANTLVNITGSVANVAPTVTSGSVKFDIVAPDGSAVASLGSMPFNQLAGNSSTNLAMTWNTGNQAAASGYAVIATLTDSMDTTVATARAPFAITTSGSGTGTGSGSGNTSDTASQTTDKQTYQPSDTVNVTDKLASTTSNTAQGPLTVVTNVVNAAGTSVFSKTETLVQLAALAQKTYSYAVALHGAAAGAYQTSVVVTDANGNTVAQAQAAFTVAASNTSGNGLSGTISVASAQVQIGNPVALAYTATNGGNSALSNLPLTVSIIDPVAQKTVTSYPTTQNIAVGATVNGSDNWTSAGTVGNNYVAVLSATVGGNSVTLAQTTFTLIAPPYKLGISQGLWNNNRVLALTACSDSSSHSDTQGSGHDISAKNQSGGGSGGGSGSGNGTCTAARYKAIDNALTALGIPHLMTTDATTFTVAMRSGLYDTLWIAEDQSAVGDSLTAEITEVVYHGATLIADGNASQCNTGFDQIGGIKSRGSLNSNQSINFNGSFYPSAQTLTTSGAAQSLTLATGAKSEAVYGNASGKPAALVTTPYGAGQVLIAGFDLGATLAAQTSGSSQATAWNSVLGTTFTAVTPQATVNLTPGQYLPVQTTVTNQGSATAVDVLSTLPQGAAYLGATPAATIGSAGGAANTATADWGLNLAVSASQTLDIAMRAPGTGGNYNLGTVVGTVANGSTTPYGSPLSFPVTVTAAATHAANATADLQALNLTGKTDQTLRTGLIASITQAMSNFNLNTYTGYGTAIGQLVTIADSLPNFSSAVSVSAQSQIRNEIGAILQEAQWRWTLLRPEVTSTLAIDKANCNPSDTVTIAESLTNVATATLTKLTVTTKVADPNNALFLTKTETLPSLAVQASQQYSYPVAIGTAAPGTYQVTMTVTDANGNVLSQSNGQFSVASSATTGAGLSGTVQVAPTQVTLGSNAVFSLTATDGGNAAFSNLPLTLTIINTSTKQAVTQFTYSGTIAIGATYSASSNWTTTGNAGTIYQAVLSATIGSKTLQLAQASFTVTAPPVQLNVSQAQTAWQNLLVLSNCKRATDGLLGQCGSVKLPVDDLNALASCDSNRAGMVAQVLNGTNANYTVTTSAADFLAKLRSGQYNGYWISNGATVLAEPQASELRAAITRGSGLIVDGTDAGLNTELANCAGVSFKGAYSSSEPLSITGKLYNPGNFTITAAPVQLGTTATSQATIGSGSTAGTGIASGQYGAGKTLAFGFDWATTMSAQSSNKAWPVIAQNSLNYVEPAAASGTQFVSGDPIALAITVQNTGGAASLQVVQTLPAGATVAGASPQAQASTQNGVTTLIWSNNLAAGASQTYQVRLQAPQAAGSYNVATKVNVVANGKATTVQSESFSFSVSSTSQLLSQLIGAVQSQGGTSAQQAVAAAAITQLNQAQVALAAAHSQDEVLRLLLSAQTRLAAIDSQGKIEPLMANVIAAVERMAP